MLDLMALSVEAESVGSTPRIGPRPTWDSDDNSATSEPHREPRCEPDSDADSGMSCTSVGSGNYSPYEASSAITEEAGDYAAHLERLGVISVDVPVSHEASRSRSRASRSPHPERVSGAEDSPTRRGRLHQLRFYSSSLLPSQAR